MTATIGERFAKYESEKPELLASEPRKARQREFSRW